MKLTKHILLFFIVLVLFTTCKKFPEDPFISLDTVKGRLKGSWKIDYIKYYGTDVTELYNDTVKPYLIKDLIFHYSFDRKSTQTGHPNVNDFNNYEGYASLYFELKDKKIYYKKNVSDTLNNIFISSEYYDIKRLYKKILKIKNANYEIQFNKISDK